jgi:hypothetical protein
LHFIFSSPIKMTLEYPALERAGSLRQTAVPRVLLKPEVIRPALTGLAFHFRSVESPGLEVGGVFLLCTAGLAG